MYDFLFVNNFKGVGACLKRHPLREFPGDGGSFKRIGLIVHHRASFYDLFKALVSLKSA